MNKEASKDVPKEQPTTTPTKDVGPPISDLADVLMEITRDKEKYRIAVGKLTCGSIVIVGFGASWSFPATKMWKYLSKVKATGVKVFLIDQEKHRSFCQDNGIIGSFGSLQSCLTVGSVGTPVVMIWYGGKQMMFSKGEWEPSKLLRGMLNPNQIEDLISSAFSAVDMGADEIHVTA